MAWEIEITDRYSSWGTAGRVFRPGIYIVDDERILKAAREMEGIIVRRVKAKDEPADETFPEAEQPKGPITTEDLKGSNAQEFFCDIGDCGAGPYKTRAGLSTHKRRAHQSS